MGGFFLKKTKGSIGGCGYGCSRKLVHALWPMKIHVWSLGLGGLRLRIFGLQDKIG